MNETGALEDALDRLIDAGAVHETDDGMLSTTQDFEDVRDVYHDTYGDAKESVFQAAIGELFDVDRETAAERIEREDVTREELVAYLAVQSFLDDPPDQDTLAHMAAVMVELGPGSPVPDPLPALDDDTYESFLADHPDSLLSVWTHGCSPCEAMKEDLDAILSVLPDGVAAAGLDGETAVAFRRAFEVDAAPTMLLFRDGRLEASMTGRQSPEAVEERVEDVYA
ncbi:MAG: thioredoxin family protein [Haloferacaceae archaeon]